MANINNIFNKDRLFWLIENEKTAKVFFSLSVFFFIYVIFCFVFNLFYLKPEPENFSEDLTKKNNTLIFSDKEIVASSVVNLHLFGVPSKTTQEIVTKMSELSIRLVGVLSTGIEFSKSSAILSTEEGSEKVYYVGDIIPGGATLVKVSPKMVILERNSVLEVLKMPETNSLPEEPLPPL